MNLYIVIVLLILIAVILFFILFELKKVNSKKSKDQSVPKDKYDSNAQQSIEEKSKNQKNYFQKVISPYSNTNRSKTKYSDKKYLAIKENKSEKHANNWILLSDVYPIGSELNRMLRRIIKNQSNIQFRTKDNKIGKIIKVVSGSVIEGRMSDGKSLNLLLDKIYFKKNFLYTIKNRPHIQLVYEGEPNYNQYCIYKILTTNSRATDLVLDTNKWVYTKVRSRSARRKLSIIKKGILKLEIEGHGFDNRCRWCRSFRTALENNSKKRFGKDSFIKIGNCPEDEKNL